jgi:hypothetical protein
MKQVRSDEHDDRHHREHPANDASDPTFGSRHQGPVVISSFALLSGTIDAPGGLQARKGRSRWSVEG